MNRISALLLIITLSLTPSIALGYLGENGLHAQKKEKAAPEKGGKKGKKGGGTSKTASMDPKTKERVDYLFIEANTLYLQEKKTEAIGLFKELLLVDPKNHATLYSIGKIQNELKNYGEGSKYCKMAVDLNPDNFWYYTELANAYQGAREVGKALEVQEALTKRFPDDKNARYDLAQLYILNKDFNKAIETYTQLEKLVGANDEITFRKHELYVYTNQTDKALTEIDKLIAANPTETRYWQAKYDLLMLMNKNTEAQAVLAKILERNPNDAFALLSLADYYKNNGQIQKSDEYLQRAFDNPEVDLDTKIKILSELYANADKEPSTMARLDRMSMALLKLYPKSALVLGIRGDVLQAAQEPDSARSYYRKSLAVDPTNMQVWSEMLLIDSEQNDFISLQKDAEKALEYYPNEILFLYFFGSSATQNGEYEEAIYAFEKIKKTEQKDKEVLLQTYLSLAECYHKTENYPKSDENFDAALKLAPNKPLVLNNYAYYLSLRNERLDDATKMVQQALAAEPNNGAYQDTYGWILYLQGDYKAAEQWIGKAAQQGGGSEVLEHYGDTWAKLKDMTKAKDYWQQAITQGAKFSMDDKVKASDR
jgi:tetratricopeptide (TPR) repeat protein